MVQRPVLQVLSLPWRLLDINKTSADNKYLIHLPDPAVLVTLKVGMHVSVIASKRSSSDDDGPSAESVWLRVCGITGLGKFVGTVVSPTTIVTDVFLGRQIEFESKHVAKVAGAPPSRLELLCEQLCVVSAALEEEGAIVGKMYRQESEGESDSGWRFFVGTESRDYLADARNLIVTRLGDLLQVDDSVLHYLHSPVGSRYCKSSGEGFVKEPGAAVLTF
jgi:hypothetical protein